MAKYTGPHCALEKCSPNPWQPSITFISPKLAPNDPYGAERALQRGGGDRAVGMGRRVVGGWDQLGWVVQPDKSCKAGCAQHQKSDPGPAVI